VAFDAHHAFLPLGQVRSIREIRKNVDGTPRDLCAPNDRCHLLPPSPVAKLDHSASADGALDLPEIQIVHVRVYDDAIAQVEVELEGAPPVSLRVVAGHALRTVAKEERILALVGRNPDGDEVTRPAHSLRALLSRRW
jgi:hypothetical protein